MRSSLMIASVIKVLTEKLGVDTAAHAKNAQDKS